jgi:hypothetical protein
MVRWTARHIDLHIAVRGERSPKALRNLLPGAARRRAGERRSSAINKLWITVLTRVSRGITLHPPRRSEDSIADPSIFGPARPSRLIRIAASGVMAASVLGWPRERGGNTR